MSQLIPLRIAICDSNLDRMRGVFNLLEADYAHFNILPGVTSIREAKECIENNKPHIVICNEHLEDGMCFDLLDQVDRSKFETIIVASTSHLAHRAYQYGVINFLVRPASFSDLSFTINRLITGIGGDKFGFFPPTERWTSLRTSKGTDMIDCQYIVSVDSYNSMTTLHFEDTSQLVTFHPIGWYVKKFPDLFIRCHMSHLVNRRYIKRIDNSNLFIQLVSGLEVPIARRRKKTVLEAIRLSKEGR